MKTTANKKYENNLQNATNYLKQEGYRKAPNNRIKGKSFFQISNEGADLLIEKLRGTSK